LVKLPRHDGLRRLLQHLNYVYKSEPALWDQDDSHHGFEWLDFSDADNSIVAWARHSREDETVVFLVNATPIVRYSYHLGVPASGFYREIINTDAETYGGSNVGNLGGIRSTKEPWGNREHSIRVNLPALAVVGLKKEKLAMGGEDLVLSVETQKTQK
jgi:1,4-alpha-glucan branching enzyme